MSSKLSAISDFFFSIIKTEEKMKNGADIVERIDKFLTEKNIKRTVFASAVGITNQSITDWKTRGTVPASDIALRIAEYLGVSVEWLITGVSPAKRSAEELELLKMFSQLDDAQKDGIFALMQSNIENNLKEDTKALG